MTTAPEPVKGPELDDMFEQGMKFLLCGSLLLGTAQGVSNMMGPNVGPLVETMAELQVAGSAMSFAGQVTRPQQNDPDNQPRPGGPS